MSKWRSKCPDVLLTRITQGFEAQLYLLRQTGPTGFLVKEHDNDRKYKVFLGSFHECDCSVFHKERELCKHIIWILTKKFRVAKEDPLVFQLGLNERELNNVIYGAKQPVKRVVEKIASAGTENGVEKKKEIETDDVCPICQEDIYNTKKALIHCKFGCGNSIHVNCMKVWADHRKKSTNEEIVRCPLCRTEFSSHSNIIKEYSLAKAKEKSKLQQKRRFCSSCSSQVVTGEYYRCVVCRDVLLCSKCILTKYHREHAFEYRKSGKDTWSKAARHSSVSLAPNVSRFDVNNNEISPVKQDRFNSRNKSVDKIRSRLVHSANTGSLPDLSLGVTGINLTSDERLPVGHSGIRLPPLLNKRSASTSSGTGPFGRVKSMKQFPKKEHTIPVEGISGIISVSSLNQSHDRVGSL